MKFSRTWAMPSPDTFNIPAIAEFVKRYAVGVVVDPFARNSTYGTHTNDLNPQTTAQHHMEAVDFLKMLVEQGVKANCVLFDPPYSPRQISECYAGVGKKAGMKDTQSGALYAACRSWIKPLLVTGGAVLQFGWNSCGFGDGFVMEEILLVAHGGPHNDTICTAHRKIAGDLF